MAVTFREVVSSTQWDEHMLRWAPGALFQSWSWGEVVRALGSSLWRIGIFEGDRMIGGMQIAKITARRGPFLHVRHGPVLEKATPVLWRTITAYLKTRAKEENAWFVRVSPQLEDTGTHTALFGSLGYRSAPIHAMDAEQCWVVDLAPSPDELLLHMRKTTRYEIRQAEKLGVQVRMSTDQKDIKEFLELYTKTATRQKFVPHQGITEEFRAFAPTGRALLFLGYHEKKLLSGALILFVGNQAIYHHGASVYSKVPVSVYVQWKAMLEAKKRGAALYNFWGVAPENKPKHPWWGFSQFKKGFGGREMGFLHTQDLPTSPLYVFPWVVETIRRITRGY